MWPRLNRWGQNFRSWRVVHVFKDAGISWYSARTFELGAALAYYAIFAITPVVLLAIDAASLLLGKQGATGQMLTTLQGTLGRTVAGSILDTVHYTHPGQPGAWAAIGSGLVFFFGVTGLFSQLQSALNRIWQVQPKAGRGLWETIKDRFWSFVVVLGVGLLLLAALAAGGALAALRQPGELPGNLIPWRMAAFLISFVFLTLGLALVYQLLPDAEIAWQDVWVGALVSAALFVLGNWLIDIYLRWSGTRTAYGAAGSLVVLLVWVYYSAQVLLYGAEFTRAYARESGKPIRPMKNAVAVPPPRPAL
jgi:membrane protein